MTTYRYDLSRFVGGLGFERRGPIALAWIMLNPSTADAIFDDPTIRKLRGFTERAEYVRFHVANLYPMRATDPRALHASTEAERLGDPDAADESIRAACLASAAVVVAWGAHGGRYPERVRRVAQLVIESGRPVFALLGPTRNGQPRHPLMAAYSTPLVPVDDWLLEVSRA